MTISEQWGSAACACGAVVNLTCSSSGGGGGDVRDNGNTYSSGRGTTPISNSYNTKHYNSNNCSQNSDTSLGQISGAELKCRLGSAHER